jgi:hypothetical protein
MHVYERDLRPAPKAAANFVSEVMDGWKAVFYYDREVAKNTMKVKNLEWCFHILLMTLKLSCVTVKVLIVIISGAMMQPMTRRSLHTRSRSPSGTGNVSLSFLDTSH